MAEQKHSAETMEELMNSIRRACELAQNLESNLPNLANQPRMLCLSIDEIVNRLNAAKEELLVSQMMPHEMKQPQLLEASSMQEYPKTTNQLLMKQLQATITAPYDAEANWSEMMGMVDFPQLLRSRGTLQIGRKDAQDSEISKGSEPELQAIEASSSRPRRSKKVDLEKITKMVAAPELGNSELPSDIDGFSWRKYGQKEILGSKYPRSYYRCTHQKLYECLAKKQVQRDDENPSMFCVTYRGTHTCHKSSTAPSSSSIPQPPLLELVDMPHHFNTQQLSTQLPSPSSASASGRWLKPINLCLQMGAGAHGSSGGGGSGGGDYPVVDMADAMFNSGSSSGNSMESLFPPSNED